MSTYQEIATIVDAYQSNQFVFAHRGMLRKLGINPTLILSELLAKLKYHSSMGELQPDGSFWCTIEKLYELTTLSQKAQATAIKVLVEYGLVEVFYGQGKVRFFRMVLDKIKELGAENALPVKKEKKKVVEVVAPKQEEAPKKVEVPESVEVPQENVGNSRREVPETPEGLTYKKHNKTHIKPKDNISDINSSSSKEINLSRKMDRTRKEHLTEFLSERGFSEFLILQTINAMEQKGIVRFHKEQLLIAYTKLVSHPHKVICPHIFYANGVGLALSNIPNQVIKPKTAETSTSEVPIYNWLEVV